MATTSAAAASRNSVLALLRDAAIKADVAKYLVDDRLSYNGMLAILRDVAVRGTVTETVFRDLQTLVAKFNTTGGIQVSDYLYSISNSLINGNPANTTWTGGARGNLTIPLGNLAPGSSQSQLDLLIGKWFLGTDLPAPNVADETGVYAVDHDPLYNPTTGRPDPTDINQGDLGDCYFLASLAEVAKCDPTAITSMIVDNGNGTYGVRFYDMSGSNPTWVTVNRELPYDSKGNLIANQSRDIWSCLAEKAFAQVNAEPGEALPGQASGNNYELRASSWPKWAIAELTGQQSVDFDSDSGFLSFAKWIGIKDALHSCPVNL